MEDLQSLVLEHSARRWRSRGSRRRCSIPLVHMARTVLYEEWRVCRAARKAFKTKGY